MTFAELKSELGYRAIFRGSEFPCSARRYQDWCRRRLLTRVVRGIYRLSERTNYQRWELAALLAPNSYLTSWTALDVNGLLKLPYDGPVISAGTDRAFRRYVDGQCYRYLNIKRSELHSINEFTPPCKVASPTTAILDLCHRKGPIIRLDSPIRYEMLDPDELLEELLSTKRRSYRRVLGRLLAFTRKKRRTLRLRCG